MAYRTLELTLISAKDLKDVNFLSKMDVYAVATISGDHRTQQRTPVDRDGGKNPSWNSSLRFSVPAEPSAAARLVIDIIIRSEHTFGDRDVGEVHVPVKELLEGIKPGSNFVSYQVRKPHSSKARGVLNLSYRFFDLPATTAPTAPFHASNPANSPAIYPPQEKPAKGNEPVMAYPAAGASGSGYPPSYPPQGGYPTYPPPQAPQGGYPTYPPPPAWSGYGAPPPAGYGYGAPPASGYGYAAVPPRKKNNLGLGLGAGLIGGALGGMLIGDMISDEGAYDAGYDAGFDNGFDF